MVAYDQPVELYLDGEWTEITADVRDDITITRGSGPDTGFAPAKLTCTIDNLGSQVFGDGTLDEVYSPLNPESPLFDLIGTNTRIRNYYRAMQDGFGRTVSNGWGTAPDGRVWATSGVGTSAVNGSAATITISTDGSALAALLQDTDGNRFRTAELRFTVTPSVSSITGGAIRVAAEWRRQDADNMYRGWLILDEDESITLEIRKIVDGTNTVLATKTLTGLTYSGQALTVAFLVEGPVLALSAWDPTDGEPLDWQLVTTDDSLTDAGMPAIRCSRDAGNTNATVTFTIDDLEVRVPLFTGEVERWPQEDSLDDKDVTVPVAAFGPSRRLVASGTKIPAVPAARRAILLSEPVEYWPLDDGVNTQVGSSALPSGRRLSMTAFVPDFNIEADIGVGTCIDIAAAGQLAGFVTMDDTGAWSISLYARLLMTATSTVTLAVARMIIAGSTISIIISTSFNGFLVSVTGAGTMNSTLGIIPDDELESFHVVVTAEQSGSDIAMTLRVNGEQVDTLTVSSKTIAPISEIIVGGDSNSPAGSITMLGQFALYDEVFTDNLLPAFLGFDGETAADRVERVSDEEGVTGVVVGNTILMGPQASIKSMEILQSVPDTDGGVLAELRGVFGFIYHSQASLYNRPPALELTYGTNGHVGHPLRATADTAGRVNDMTVKRTGGGEARVIDQANIDADQRYPQRVELPLYSDSQARPIAAWAVAVGVWPESRYGGIALRPDALTARSDLFLAMISLDITDRVFIASAPKRHGAEGVDQLIRGLIAKPRDNTWAVTANGVPGRVWDVGVLGTARLTARGSTISEDLTTTETDISVSNSKTRWSQNTPYDIVINGERMTLTNATTPGPTQTLTVTRSVNGVVRTHASGSEVRMYQPMRFARGGRV